MHPWSSKIALEVKQNKKKTCLPMEETYKKGVQSLDWEHSLEGDIASHSSILAWRIPRTEEPGGLNPWGHKESDMTEDMTDVTSRHTYQAYQPLNNVTN